MLTRRVLAVPGSVMPVDMGPGVLPTRAGPTSSQRFGFSTSFAMSSSRISGAASLCRNLLGTCFPCGILNGRSIDQPRSRERSKHVVLRDRFPLRERT